MSTVFRSSQPSPSEHEIKLVTPAGRVGIVAAWLRGRCLPDPEHPGGTIHSIYFDNRAGALLRAKVNSDFVKHKVRLRWYADAATGAVQDPAFVELKNKVGGRRHKHRLPLEEGTAARIAALPPASQLRALLAPLRDAGHWVDTDLQPFVRVVFRRRRFIEPASGTRVSIDGDIRGTSLNPGLLPMRNPAPLAHAVIEVKGPHQRLPPALATLRALGCVPESFSKYARCYQKLARRHSF